MDLNLNAAECIKEVSTLGHSTYVNICNNTTHIVPWGIGDWIATVVMGLIVLFAIGLIGLIAADTLTNW